MSQSIYDKDYHPLDEVLELLPELKNLEQIDSDSQEAKGLRSEITNRLIGATRMYGTMAMDQWFQEHPDAFIVDR